MDHGTRLKLLLALIGLLTLGGMLIIIVLLILWRRYNARINKESRRETGSTSYTDAWQVAGTRYQNSHSQDEDQDDDDIDSSTIEGLSEDDDNTPFDPDKEDDDDASPK